MKVIVDGTRCQGHALCWNFCPEVFSLDEEGYAVVAVPEVAEELESSVLNAQGGCPEGAIVVE